MTDHLVQGAGPQALVRAWNRSTRLTYPWRVQWGAVLPFTALLLTFAGRGHGQLVSRSAPREQLGTARLPLCLQVWIPCHHVGFLWSQQTRLGKGPRGHPHPVALLQQGWTASRQKVSGRWGDTWGVSSLLPSGALRELESGHLSLPGYPFWPDHRYPRFPVITSWASHGSRPHGTPPHLFLRAVLSWVQTLGSLLRPPRISVRMNRGAHPGSEHFAQFCSWSAPGLGRPSAPLEDIRTLPGHPHFLSASPLFVNVPLCGSRPLGVRNQKLSSQPL